MSASQPVTAGTPIPKYLEIVEALDDELRHAPEGHRLPTERELAERFGVSRMTLRQALDELARAGRVERVRGSGTFTRKPTVTMGPSLTSFTQDMRQRGLHAGSRLLGFTQVAATPQVAAALAVPVGAEVIWLERLRTADGEPMCVEVSHFPIRFLRNFEETDLEGSLHELLRASGAEPTSVQRRVRALSAEPREALFLDLAEGAPMLEVLDIFADAANRPIQFACSRYRADRYEVSSSITMR